MNIPKLEQIIKVFYKDDKLKKPLFELKNIIEIVNELKEMNIKIPCNEYEYKVWRNYLYQIIYNIADKEFEENGRILVKVRLEKGENVRYGFTKSPKLLAINLLRLKKRRMNAIEKENKYRSLTENLIGIAKIKNLEQEIKKLEKEEK